MEKNVVCYYWISGKLKGVAQVTMTFGKWTQLLMLVLLLIVVLFIFGVTLSSSRAIRQQVLDSYEGTIQMYSQLVSGELRAMEVTLSNLLYTQTTTLYAAEGQGDDTAVKMASQSLVTALTQNAQLSSNADGAFLLRPDGHILLSQYTVYPLSDMDALKALLTEEGSVPSNAWCCRKVGGRWCLIRVYPFSASLLGVYVDVEALLRDLKQNSLVAVGDYCLLDQSGAVFADTLAGNPIGTDFRLDGESLTLAGQRYTPVASALGPHHLRLAAMVSEESLIGGIRRNYLIALAFSLLLITLVIGVYFATRRQLLRPFSVLSGTMKAFRDGNVDARAHVTSHVREINETVESFNDMAGEVTRLKIENYESQLARSRTALAFYQLQIRPHFLINTLNTIYSLAQVKNFALIQELTMFLVKYYRYTIKATGNFVRLKDELEHVRNYLGIHQMRLGERLDVTLDVADDCLEAAVPPLMLHTFVENTVQYAVSMDDVTFLAIEIRREGETMRCIISDTGAGFPEEYLTDHPVNEEQTEHIGMYNVRQRLLIAYEGRAKLTLTNTRPHGAQVDITVPFIPYESGREAGAC